MSESRPLPSELQDVVTAAARLPLCDRAAALHALIARLVHETQAGGSVAEVADALIAAATEALIDDPWVQFEAAARRLKAGQSLATGSLTPDLVHEREGHGLPRILTTLD